MLDMAPTLPASKRPWLTPDTRGPAAQQLTAAHQRRRADAATAELTTKLAMKVVTGLSGRPGLGDDAIGDAAIDADRREAAGLRAVDHHQTHQQRTDLVLDREAQGDRGDDRDRAGLTAPTDVSTAAMKNMIHGIAAMRPRTARTAS